MSNTLPKERSYEEDGTTLYLQARQAWTTSGGFRSTRVRGYFGFPSRDFGRYTVFVPAVLRVRGYRFFFFSKEGNEPPHIHVDHAGRHAKFWLSPVHLARNHGFRGHELKELQQIVSERREFLEEKWNGHLPGGL